MFYKIKSDIIWRNELNSFILLHSLSKKLLFFPLKISNTISQDGIIKQKKGINDDFIKYLNNENLIDKYEGKIDNKYSFGPIDTISGPLNATLQITNVCNLKCLHCHRKEKGNIHFDLKKIFKLIDELREMKVFNLNMSGGEPLMFPDLFKVIEYGFSKGMKVTMSSNLLLMNESIARKLAELGLRNMHISLDSSIEDNHDKIRALKGTFKKMISNLKYLKNNNIEFTFVTTLINQGIREYSDTIDLAYELGASAHKTNLLVPQGEGKTLEVEYYIKNEVFDEIKKVFQDKRIEYKNKMNVLGETMFLVGMKDETNDSEAKPEILKYSCPAGVTTICFTEIGEVLPCPFFSEYSVDNIFESSFKDIWQKNEILINLRNDKNNSGCRARSYYFTGDISGEDYFSYKN